MKNEFGLTPEEWDALVKRLEEDEKAAALEQLTCLVCLAGQRNVKEMIWCDKCPAQICIRHSNQFTLKGWDVASWGMLCPACKYAKTVRITVR